MRKFILDKFYTFILSICVVVILSYIIFFIAPIELLEQKDFFSYLKQLTSPFDITFINDTNGEITNFWMYIKEPYLYSITILFIAIIVTVFLSSLISIIYLLASKKMKRLLELIADFIGSIPDLMIMLALQLFFVWLFKKTGTAIFNIYALGETKAYFLPVLSLSILPTLHFFPLIILNAKNEENKPYVEFAYSRGFSKLYVLIVHIFRNVVLLLINQFTLIFSFMVTSLLVIETVFNIHGFMGFILKSNVFTPATLCMWILLLFVPFYLLYTLIHTYFFRLTGGNQHED